jgi:hypothetical protein
MSGYFVQIRRVDAKKWKDVSHFSNLDEALSEMASYRLTRARMVLGGDPQFRIVGGPS